MKASLSPDQILLGPVPCARCHKQIEPGAGRAVLVISAEESLTGSPKVFIACIKCARDEAGLNNELAKHTSSEHTSSEHTSSEHTSSEHTSSEHTSAESSSVKPSNGLRP